MVRSEHYVRYLEKDGTKVVSDVNLMKETQFQFLGNNFTTKENGDKVYTFDYEGVSYKATNVWFDDSKWCVMLIENVEYNSELDLFIFNKYLDNISFQNPPST